MKLFKISVIWAIVMLISVHFSFAMFVQPDTQINDVYDPQNLNRYMFERGNPYMYTDPDGHFLQVAVGVVIVAIVVVSTAKWGMNLYEARNKGIDARIDAHVEAIQDLSTPVSEGIRPGGLLIKESLDAKV